MGSPVHLIRRFFSSITAKPPSSSEVEWAHQYLNPQETALWSRMSVPDQAHSIDVAQRVLVKVGTSHHEAMAAALLHDVGKVESDLGTALRSLATLVWAVLPSDKAYKLASRSGITGRIAQYHLHPDIGARLCCEAGSAQLVSAWAGEHHKPSDAWTVPLDLGNILKECDDN